MHATCVGGKADTKICLLKSNFSFDYVNKDNRSQLLGEGKEVGFSGPRKKRFPCSASNSRVQSFLPWPSSFSSLLSGSRAKGESLFQHTEAALRRGKILKCKVERGRIYSPTVVFLEKTTATRYTSANQDSFFPIDLWHVRHFQSLQSGALHDKPACLTQPWPVHPSCC